MDASGGFPIGTAPVISNARPTMIVKIMKMLNLTDTMSVYILGTKNASILAVRQILTKSVTVSLDQKLSRSYLAPGRGPFP